MNLDTEGSDGGDEVMEVIPLTGNIGARVEGIRVSQPLPDETIAELRRALLHYKVIFLHDEGLTYDAQVAYARRFGEVINHPLYSGPVAEPLLQPMDSVAGARADHWHTDLTFVRQPSAFAFLRCVVIPPVGGDTMWANTAAAYASLPDGLRALADQLRIVHSTESDYTEVTGGPGIENLFEAEHPAVRVHPETGERALLLGGFARRVVGFSPQASRDLIRILQDHVTRPEHTVRWKWRLGDLAIWDNAATQHYAVRDYGSAHRRTERVMVGGPIPVAIDGRPSESLSMGKRAASAEALTGGVRD
jgi:taurine dioxygenase